MRLFPLSAVSEITLVKRGRRAAAKTQEPQPAAWDPGVA
jgi:hypothetical protein